VYKEMCVRECVYKGMCVCKEMIEAGMDIYMCVFKYADMSVCARVCACGVCACVCACVCVCVGV